MFTVLSALGTVASLIPSSLVNELRYAPPLERAIKRTQQKFPPVAHDLAKSLRSWISNDEVISVIRAMKTGLVGETNEDQLLDLFTASASVEFDKDAARRFLLAFLHAFEQEVYKESTAAWLLHRRLTQEHGDTRREIQDEHATTRSEIARNRELLEELVAHVGVGGPANVLAPTTEVGEGEPPSRWKSRIDEIREILRDGKVETAIELYERLLGNADFIASARHRDLFRVHCNIGVGHFSLGDVEAALTWIEQARTHDSEDPIGRAMLAQILLVQDDRERARGIATKVLEDDPEHVMAWGIMLQTSPSVVDFERVPQAVKKSPDFWLAAAGAAYNRRDLAAVPKLAQTAVEAEDAKPSHLVKAAELLYHVDQLEGTARLDSPHHGKVLALVRLALERLGPGGNPAVRAQALLLQGLVTLADDPTEALSRIQEALDANPKDQQVQYALARGLYEVRDFEAALFVLRSLEQGTHRARAAALRARVFTVQQRPPETIEAEIRSAMRGPVAAIEKRSLLRDLADTSTRANLPLTAKEIVALLEEDGAELDGAFLLVMRARIAADEGEVEKAISAYQSAMSVEGVHRADAGLELGGYLLSQGKYKAAAAAFEASGAAEERSEVRRAYGGCLVQLGQWDKVAMLLRTADEEGRSLEVWELDLASMLALETNDFSSAVAYLEELTRVSEGGVDATVRLAYALLRIGAVNRACTVLGELGNLRDLDTSHLIQIAQLYFQAGDYAAALLFSYRAYRTASQDVQAAGVFVGLFFETPDSLDIKQDSAEAGPDTAVELQPEGGGDKVTLLLVELPENRPEEVAVASDTGKRLLGKRVGDQVLLRPGDLDPVEYRVAKIRSGLTHSALEAAEMMRTRATRDAPSLQAVRTGSPDSVRFLAPVIAALYQGEERRKLVLELYENRRLPLGFVASSQGESLRRTYKRIAFDDNIPLWVESGTSESQTESTNCAAQSQVIILDISALLTLQVVGHLDLLKQLHPEVRVAPTVVENLRQELRSVQLEIHRGGGKRMSGGARGMVIYELPVEVLQREGRELDELISFLEVEVTLTPRPVESLTSNSRVLPDALGDAAHDTLMLCSPERPLYADDEGLRMLAAGERQGKSFSSFAFLEAAEAKGLISRDERWAAVTHLADMRHSYLPLSADYLFYLLRQNGYTLGSKLRQAAERLGGPQTDSAGALSVAAEFVRRVALAPIGGASLWGVSMLLLAAFGTGGRPARIEQLEARVKAALYLHPLAYREFSEAKGSFLNSRGV